MHYTQLLLSSHRAALHMILHWTVLLPTISTAHKVYLKRARQVTVQVVHRFAQQQQQLP